MTKEVDLIKAVSSNDKKTYSYLVLELSPERLCIEGHRIVLRKFAKVVWSADLIAMIAQYEENLEVSDRNACAYSHKCISGENDMPESVTQM